MRRTSLLLVLLFSTVLCGLRAQQTVTYLNEDFQQTTGSALPAGWDNSTYQCSSTSPASYIWKSYTGGYYPPGGTSSNQRCAYLYAYYSYTTYAALMTPAISLPTARDVILSFKLKNSTYGGDMDIYVSTDGGATFLNNPIATHISTGTTYQEYEYFIRGYGGRSINIVFYGRPANSTQSAYYYLDDVKVVSAPTCQEPVGLYVSSLDTTRATLNWGLKGQGYGAVPDTFRVQLLDSAGTLLVDRQVLGTQGYQTAFTGLSPSTHYTARVQSNCDASFQGFSDWVELDFSTMNIPLPLPYETDFDDLDDLPAGIFTQGASVNTSASLSYGGTGRSLKLTTTVSDMAYVTTPILRAVANNVEVDYMVRRASTSYPMHYSVGYVTDPSDLASTFVPFFTDTLASGTDWVNRRVNTALVQDNTTPIMICILVESGQASSIYIDNLSVHLIPTCTRPELFQITDYTATTATFSWTMSTAPVLIRALNLTDSTTLTATAQSSPYTMTGLNGDTEYRITAQAVCSATDSSDITPSLELRTLCSVADSALFFENFDDYTGIEIPHCWTMGWLNQGTTVYSSPFQTGTTYKHGTSGRAMTLRDQQRGNISYMSTRLLPIDQAGKYMVSLWVYRPSASSYHNEGIQIWVNSVPDDTVGGTMLGYIHRHYQYAPVEAVSAQWYNYEYVIPAAGNQYVVIVGLSDYGTATYFDDFGVVLAPTCPKVTEVDLDSVGRRAAAFSWTPGLSETQWLVDYRVTVGTATVVDTTVVVSQPELTVQGLNPATTYNINMTVRALCGAQDTAEAVNYTTSFTTECEPLTALPYMCGFEADEIGTGSYPMPFCWHRVTDNSTSSTQYPYSYSNATYARTGQRSLYHYQTYTVSTSYSANPAAVLPEIDTHEIRIDSLQLSLWARVSSAPNSSYGDGTIIVGVMTDPTDMNTFVDLDTITVTQTTYTRFIVPLTGYTGTGAYVAFRMPRPAAKSNYLRIDDVVLDRIPNCQELVGSGTVADIGLNDARITVSDLTATSSWSYAYGDEATELVDMTPRDATTATVQLTGLSAGTTYTVYFRRNCGSGDYSPWSESVTFTTLTPPDTIPFICDFENTVQNNGWRYANATGVNNLIIGTATDAVYSGTHALYVSNNGSVFTYTNSSASKCFVYRNFRFDESEYKITFRWQMVGGESTWDWGRVMIVPAATALVGGTGTSYSSTTFPNFLYAFDPQGKNYMNLTGTTADPWNQYNGKFDMRGHSGFYNLVFMWNNDASGGTQPPISFDDIVLTRVSCYTPSNINVALTSSTAVLSYTQPNTGAYELVVDTAAFTDYTVPSAPLYHAIDTVGSASFTGLTPNTEYYYAVRAICQPGDTSDWTTVQTFRTYCTPAAMPYSTGFEDIDSTLCWSQISGSSSGTVGRNTSYRHSGTASLCVNAATALSPELDVDSLNGYYIHGYAYSTTDSARVGVGLITDPADPSTYENFGNVLIPNRSTWTEFVSYFTQLDDDDYADFRQARHIVLTTGNNTVYFDDIAIEPAPQCPQPTEMQITNVTDTSLVLGFVDNAGAQRWSVLVNGQETIITTNPATITGLLPATTYTVEVAAICQSGDTSDYSPCGTLRTQCSVMHTPWQTSFEPEEGYTHTSYFAGDLEEKCWNTLNVKPNGQTYPYYYTSSSTSGFHSGIRSLYLYSYKSTTTVYKDLILILPEFDAPANRCRVSFWYKNTSTTATSKHVQLGYITDLSQDSTFVLLQDYPLTTGLTQVSLATSNFPNVPANARLAIRHAGGDPATTSTGSYAYIDDIEVIEIRNCSDPDGLRISNLTSDACTVAFNDTCRTHTNWEYTVGAKGFNPDAATPVAITTRSFNLSGLQDDTDYDLYVRAICGPGDLSNWVKVSFRTECVPFNVTTATPFFDDFEDFEAGSTRLEGCYDQKGDTSSYFVKSYANSVTTTTNYHYTYDGDYCLYMYQYKNYCPEGLSFYRRFHLTGGKTYRLSMFARAGSYNSVLSAYVGTTTNISMMRQIFSDQINTCSYTNLGGTPTLYEYAQCWGEHGDYFSVPQTGDYYILVHGAPTGTNSYSYIYVDNMSVEEFACGMPAENISDLTTTTATINYTQADAQKWQVVVDTLPFRIDSLVRVPMVNAIDTSGSTQLTGLVPNTEYYYALRAICGTADTSRLTTTGSFRTYCNAFTVPYSEDFEQAENVTCWSTLTATGSISRNTSYKKAGAASFKVDKASAVSPEFTVTSLAPLALNGFAYTTVDNAHFDVGVIVDPVDPTTYVTIGSFVIPKKNTWTEFDAYFNPLTEDDYSDFVSARRFVIAAGANIIYFDNLVLDTAPSCPKPSMAVISNVTASSFDLAFTDNAHASQWAVRVNGVLQTVNQNPCTITGLAPSHNYTVEVAAVCQPGDTSEFIPAGSLRTECVAASLPWICGFEPEDGYVTGVNTYAAQSLENSCWNTLNIKPNGTSYPYYYLTTSATNRHGGRQGLYIYTYMTSSSTYKDPIFIFPEFVDSVNDVNVEYWYKNNSSTATYPQLEFGYMTDPAVESSFVVLTQNNRTSSWTFFSTSMSNYTGVPGNARLAVRFKNPKTYTSTTAVYPTTCIDDIRVYATSTCTQSVALSARNVGENTADIVLSSTAPTREYVVGLRGTNPNTATVQTTTADTIHLTGLADGEHYEVFARGVCNAQDKSAWNKVSFTTECAAYYVTDNQPYECDFEELQKDERLSGCVIVRGDSGTYMAKGYINTATYTYVHGGNVCVYINTARSYSPHGIILYRKVRLEAGNTYQLQGYARATSYTSYLKLYMGTAADFDSLTLVAQAELPVCASTTITGTPTTYTYADCFEEVTGFFTAPYTGDYYFAAQSDYGEGQNYAYQYVDDLSVTKLAGCMPSSATVDSTTTTTARISIDSYEPGDTYIYYVTDDLTGDTVVASTTNQTGVISLTGLAHSSDYTIFVRHDCGNGQLSPWTQTSFSTDCAPFVVTLATPFYDSFENAPNGGRFEGCYQKAGEHTTTYFISGYAGTASTKYARTGNTCLRYYGYSSYCRDGMLAVRQLVLQAGKTYQIKAYARATSYVSSAKLVMGGTMSSLSDLAEVDLAVCNSTAADGFSTNYKNCWQELIAVVTPTADGTYLIGVKAELGTNQSYFYVYVDDFSVEELPSCMPPTRPATVNSRTMTTVSVSVPMDSRPQAEIGWVQDAQGVTAAQVVNTVTTTTGDATLTGLTAGTAYQIYYRYICDTTDTSAWSPRANATTTLTDCFEPQNLHTVGVVNGHHAAFAWGPAPDAVGYEYELRRGTTVLDSGITANDTVVYDSLAATTTYTFRVRTLCSTDTTAWQSLTVQTSGPAFELPFICDFEDSTINAGWTLRNPVGGSNRLCIGTAAAAQNGGQRSLYETTDGSTYTYTGSISGAYAEVPIAMEAGTYTVSYTWKHHGEGTLDYGRVFLIPYSKTLTSAELSYSTLRTALPAGAIPADGDRILNMQDSWKSEQVEVEIPTGAVYKLVVAIAVDGSVQNMPAFAIDNIYIDRMSCTPLRTATATLVTDNGATVTVQRNMLSQTFEYGYSTSNNIDSVATWTVVPADNQLVSTINLTGLAPSTNYCFFARAYCDSVTTSAATIVSFTTKAQAQTIPFICDFENTAQNAGWTFKQGTTGNRWMIGTATSYGTGSRSLYITENGTSHSYSITTAADVYAVIPITVEAGSYDVNYDYHGYGESCCDYMRVFLLPTSVSLTAGSLLSGVGTSTLPSNAVSLDNNARLPMTTNWIHFTTEADVPTTNVYNLVVFWHDDTSIGTMPPGAIDNIRITAISCPRIPQANISYTATETTMDIKVKPLGAQSTVSYRVYTNQARTQLLSQGTVAQGDSMIYLTGLTAGTHYWADFRENCDSANTSSERVMEFMTECAAVTTFPYSEGFESYTASSTARTELSNNCWLVASSNTSAYHYITTTTSYINSGTKGLYIYNSGTAGAIQTLALPRMTGLNGKTFSVWYKTYSTTSCDLQLGYLTNPDSTETFVPIATAQRSLNGTKLTQLLAGLPQTTRLALRAVGTSYLYLDDIRINDMADAGVYNDTVCFGSGYTAHGLTLNAGSLAPGDTTFAFVNESRTAGVADSVVTVNIHTLAELSSVVNDTACQGQPFRNGMFVIPNPQTSGTFFRVFSSRQGCDSTVVLNLTVLPTRETRFDTICQGDVYQMGDTAYTRTGVYNTVVVNSQGCSDTVSLHLFVVDSATVVNQTICQGGSYSFEGRNYTRTGTYRVAGTGLHGCPTVRVLNLTVLPTDSTINVTFCQGGQALVVDTVLTTAGQWELVRVNDQGCDVVYHITATVTPPAEGHYTDDACEGRNYNNFGYYGPIYGDTIIMQTTKTSDMCDSVTYVVVTFHPTETSEFTAHLGSDGRYDWNDNTYTQPGDYQGTFRNRFGCDSIVTLHLLMPDGVDNVEAQGSIKVVPNPVVKGQAAILFTSGVGEAVRVEILTSSGAVVDRREPNSTPVDLRAPQTSGVYYVRLITADGRVYVEKLIVE